MQGAITKGASYRLQRKSSAVISTALCLGGLGIDCSLATVYIRGGFPQSVKPNAEIRYFKQVTTSLDRWEGSQKHNSYDI